MTVGLWQTTISAPDTPPHVDTVIIGAGLIGSYLALKLRDEQRSTLVLDARHIAGGASGRNGGLLLTGVAHSYAHACALYGRDTTRELWSLTVRNREAMIGWATTLGTPVRRCGSYILACDQRQAEELRESVGLMREDGFNATWHADDPLRRGFIAGVHIPDDGAIQPASLTTGLLKASGAQVREAAEVYAIESQADGVLVRSRGGDVVAQRVVLATNAWTPLLVAEFADAIVPGRGQVIATAPAPQVLQQACYCDDGFEYFQQLPDGRFVLGGYRNLAFDAERTYADHTTPGIQSALEAFLARHFPELADVPIERRWAGTMAFTPDGLPLVGRLRRDERIAFAVGFNGHGLGLGIMVAEHLLRELQGGDAGMFAARRIMPGVV
ncbi:MAG TPA: FAD-binding oxidoreductase [Herpetosiphonaceae bacterium]